MDGESIPIFLKACLDGAYFLCCSPFRLKLRKSDQEKNNGKSGDSAGLYFTTTEWLPQKIIWFFLSIFHILQKLWKVWRFFSRIKDSSNPKNHFKFFEASASLIQESFLIWRLWRGQHHFLNVVNFIKTGESSNLILTNPSLLPKRKVIVKIIAFGVPFALSIAYLVFWMYSIFYNYKVWWEEETINLPVNYFSRDSWLAITFKVFAIGGSYQQWMFMYCEDFFNTITGLTLWLAVNGFISQFQKEIDESVPNLNGIPGKPIILEHIKKKIPNWDKIQEQIKTLKTLANMLSESFGTNYILLLTATTLYYATFTEELIGNTAGANNPFTVFALSFLNVFGFLFLSADACQQMTKFKSWLGIRENREKMLSSKTVTVTELTEIGFVIDDINSNAIALKAGNVYPITFSLIANMVGAVVTYFIICVQVR